MVKKVLKDWKTHVVKALAFRLALKYWNNLVNKRTKIDLTTNPIKDFIDTIC